MLRGSAREEQQRRFQVVPLSRSKRLIQSFPCSRALVIIYEPKVNDRKGRIDIESHADVEAFERSIYLRVEAYGGDVKLCTDPYSFEHVGKIYRLFSRVLGSAPREPPALAPRGDPLMNREFSARWRIQSSEVQNALDRIEKELGKEWKEAFQRAGFATGGSPQVS